MSYDEGGWLEVGAARRGPARRGRRRDGETRVPLAVLGFVFGMGEMRRRGIGVVGRKRSI